MNYNNFASRISTPRLTPASHPQNPAQETDKKPRKRTRRRLAVRAVLVLAFPFLILCAETRAANATASFPKAPSAFISAPGLPDAGSFGKPGLSPITQALLGIGLAVAAVQARLLIGRRELEC